MEPDATQPAARPYWPFLPLFFALAGWALLNTWLFLLGAGSKAYILPAALGSALVVCLAIPSRPVQYGTAMRDGGPPRQSRLADTVQVLFLLATGTVLASLVVGGSVFLLGVSAALLNFLPWGRLPLCRHHPAVACIVASSGCSMTLHAQWREVETMFLPLAAWAFWVAALVGLFLKLDQSRRAGRGADKESAAAAAGTSESAFSP